MSRLTNGTGSAMRDYDRWDIYCANAHMQGKRRRRWVRQWLRTLRLLRLPDLMP